MLCHLILEVISNKHHNKLVIKNVFIDASFYERFNPLRRLDGAAVQTK